MSVSFRCEEMALCQLFLHSDSAFHCIAELGEFGFVQFQDTTPDVNMFQRKFINEIKRCEELTRQINFFVKQMNEEGIEIIERDKLITTPKPSAIIDFDTVFSKLEAELIEVNTNYNSLKKNLDELQELQYLLERTNVFFNSNIQSPEIEESLNSSFAGDIRLVEKNELNLKFICGVVQRSKSPSLERMLWRACRGNVFIRKSEITELLTSGDSGDRRVSKDAFVIFFQGEQLRLRVQKICEAYHTNIYPCPESSDERAALLNGVMSRVAEIQTIMATTVAHRRDLLSSNAPLIHEWSIKVKKIKLVYHILNLFNMDVTSKAMIGECWCPLEDLPLVRASLVRGIEACGSSVVPILNQINPVLSQHGSPPTYIRTNKITAGFQNLINAYGLPTYGELNPVPFTVISFPFLFAVMFGDFGHGLIMFLFALWMVGFEKGLLKIKTDNEIWKYFFGGRYIILLMSIFSMYAGLLYNDIFSKSFNIFGSAWTPIYSTSTLISNTELILNPNSTAQIYHQDWVYPFGLDPVWQIAKNKINFTNSYKMKMSIVFAVLQMMFGTFLSLANNIHNNNKINIFCEFVPQMIFFAFTFGYLVIEIFIKWVAFDADKSKDAPQLLIGLINMFMFDTGKKEGETMEEIHSNKQAVQTTLIVIALICVPWMLLVKPLILRHLHKKEEKKLQDLCDYQGLAGESTQELISARGNDDGEEKFEFSEVMIHQMIHTIEYCLGCVSNTASYLRLWALSIAHVQLSEVAWTMVFRRGLQIDSYFGSVVLIFIFQAWAFITLAMLLLMEGLSAFLHALRLHWVEFQSKFYDGKGIPFEPFSFKKLLEEQE